jgi:glycosyltransferase involved in cell wall biosynthesis
MKKNILLIIPSGGVGGIERLAVTFYNYYILIGYDVKVLKIIKSDTDLVDFGFDELFLSTIDFGKMKLINRMLFYLKAPYLLRKIIKKNKFTHSIGFGDLPNIFSSLTYTNEFKVASLHALKSVEFNLNSLLFKVSKLCFNTSYNNFDKIVCISEDIKRDLIENCNFKFIKKLEVIYNPHNIDEIINLSNEPISLEEKLLFQKKTIIFVGRITQQKATWHLIKSFSLLENKNKINLLLIGDYVDEVKDYLDKLIIEFGIENSVFFLGRKKNPYKYMKNATVLALTSYYEGTPNVIVESIGLNLPIISSNCTNGIIELMNIHSKFDKVQQEIMETNSGLITPNFYKGNLSIPNDISYIDEEKIYSMALNNILENDVYFKEKLLKHRNQLLSKFDINKIAKIYLEKSYETESK